jgi:hypothetical protein
MIKLSEKYIRALTEYVHGIDLENWLQSPETHPAYGTLVKLIAEIHKQFLDASDVHSMIQHEVATFVADGRLEKSGLLSGPQFADDAQKLIDALREKIESYPRSYVLRIELPNAQFFGDLEVELGLNAGFVAGSYDFEPYTDKSNAIARALTKETNKSTFLLIRVTGYASTSANSPATTEGISLAKQIAFILAGHGVATRFWNVGREARCSLEDLTSRTTYFATLPQTAKECFGQLVFDLDKLRVYDRSSAATLLGGIERRAETEIERRDALVEQLSYVTRFLKTVGHPDHAHVAAAMEWHQDSIFADNETFSYLAACIGLEALLAGSEQLDGMSNRLADRYSFLMGDGRTQREQLAKDYQAVLKVRGKLVHGKQSRLRYVDRQHLYKVREMLAQGIWRDLHHMYRDYDLRRARIDVNKEL